MPMNTVIRERRKALELTQEQVAEFLNVSTPAVSKWETGTTSPDLAVLPALARLLKTDLNTLFCFRENLSDREIGLFCQEVIQIVRKDGFAAGFDAAVQKIHEYPHNEKLLHCLTLQLDGLLSMFGPEDAGMIPMALKALENDPAYGFLRGNPDFENRMRAFTKP